MSEPPATTCEPCNQPTAFNQCLAYLILPLSEAKTRSGPPFLREIISARAGGAAFRSLLGRGLVQAAVELLSATAGLHQHERAVTARHAAGKNHEQHEVRAPTEIPHSNDGTLEWRGCQDDATNFGGGGEEGQ